jgi:hypothetical protein
MPGNWWDRARNWERAKQEPGHPWEWQRQVEGRTGKALSGCEGLGARCRITSISR